MASRTKRKPLTDAYGEVRELEVADFARARPFSALPKKLQAKLRKIKAQAPAHQHKKK